jgi:hypothetical protein
MIVEGRMRIEIWPFGQGAAVLPVDALRATPD